MIFGTWNDVQAIGSLVALVSISIVCGFVIARWFYRTEARARDGVLREEIIRLRRKLSDAGQRETRSTRDREQSIRRLKAISNNIDRDAAANGASRSLEKRFSRSDRGKQALLPRPSPEIAK